MPLFPSSLNADFWINFFLWILGRIPGAFHTWAETNVQILHVLLSSKPSSPHYANSRSSRTRVSLTPSSPPSRDRVLDKYSALFWIGFPVLSTGGAMQRRHNRRRSSRIFSALRIFAVNTFLVTYQLYRSYPIKDTYCCMKESMARCVNGLTNIFPFLVSASPSSHFLHQFSHPWDHYQALLWTWQARNLDGAGEAWASPGVAFFLLTLSLPADVLLPYLPTKEILGLALVVFHPSGGC